MQSTNYYFPNSPNQSTSNAYHDVHLIIVLRRSNTPSTFNVLGKTDNPERAAHEIYRI